MWTNDKKQEIEAEEFRLAADRFVHVNVKSLPWRLRHEFESFASDDEDVVEGKVWLRIQRKDK